MATPWGHRNPRDSLVQPSDPAPWADPCPEVVSLLERYDEGPVIDEKEYKHRISPLQNRLGELQRACRDAGLPVVVVIEGWNASGITHVTNELVQFLDPRGFNVVSSGRPTYEEELRPLLWRFWNAVPAKGRFTLFARSWYSRALAEKVNGIGWKDEVKRYTAQMRHFERQLTDDGMLLLKFFLHITKEEQEKRMIEREYDFLRSWTVTRGDWDFHRHYDQYIPIIEGFIGETDRDNAPWTIISARDLRHTTLSVYEKLVGELEKTQKRMGKEKKMVYDGHFRARKKSVLRDVDLSTSLTRDEYDTLLPELQQQVYERHYLLYKRRIPLVIVFEGWDAAGKGGTIMRLVRWMNPRGYRVAPVGSPTATEKSYPFLWRFYQDLPKEGHITVFDRSWYGRVLVERVEGFCTKDEWQRAYREINEMEENFVDHGGGIVKFWLEIDNETQLERFRQREGDPKKQWKITTEDWRNRDRWDQYEIAVDDMLDNTSTKKAPWTVIESRDKLHARVKTIQYVLSAIDKLM